MSIAKVGHLYRHFKKETMIYTVLEVNVLDCENAQPMVLYRAEYDSLDHPRGTIWIRSKEEFEGKKTLPDGRVVERFTDITEL